MCKRILFISLSLLWLGGCVTSTHDYSTTSKRILSKNYLRDVQKYDGINEEEAVLLAKNEILFRGYEKSFDVNAPEIFFEDNQLWGIRFRPGNKTMSDILSGREIDIFVRKDDGRVNVRKNF